MFNSQDKLINTALNIITPTTKSERAISPKKKTTHKKKPQLFKPESFLLSQQVTAQKAPQLNTKAKISASGFEKNQQDSLAQLRSQLIGFTCQSGACFSHYLFTSKS